MSQISRKKDVISRITDEVEDIIDRFSKKETENEDKNGCVFYSIEDLKQGDGDEEIECIGYELFNYTSPLSNWLILIIH